MITLHNQNVIVIVATSSKSEAEKIALNLLNEKLIGCANILSPVTSVYYWSSKIEKSEEHLVLMKSRVDLFEKLTKKVKSLHSYDVPEILALPIVKGSKDYLAWLNDYLRKP